MIALDLQSRNSAFQAKRRTHFPVLAPYRQLIDPLGADGLHSLSIADLDVGEPFSSSRTFL
ncbi:hypothetical protein D6B98_15585 [Bradyrhizobium sp. LVM 105]|nr:hypothetical protein D6B98_15585 [Bradyrhizobium sp. LVM 105]